MNIPDRLQQAIGLYSSGKLDAAAQIYQEILQADPHNDNAHHLLGLVFRDQGNLPQAIASMTAALGLRAAEPVYYNNLGTCYFQKKEHLAATLFYRHALALKPGYVDAWINLALAQRDNRQYGEAEQALKQALTLQPQNFSAKCVLGNVYHRQRRNLEALACYEEVIAGAPDYPQAMLGMSESYFNLGRYEEALPLADRVMAMDPKLIPDAIQVKGQALEILGRMDEACNALDFGLKHTPGSVEIAFARAKMRKIKKDEPFFKLLQQYEPNIHTVTGMPKARVGYTLGKAYEDTGDIAKASKFYQIGAQAKRELEKNEEALLDRVHEIFETYCTPEYLSTLVGQEEGSEQPIFILGMPRSGTTLVEQIISSHPDVFAGGELSYAQDVLSQYLLPPMYLFNERTSYGIKMETSLQERGRIYLEEINKLTKGNRAKRITDKMPNNCDVLGLIATMLPKAKIIHCRRDPIDNCISCYTQLFTNGHEWSYDFAELGRHYRRYWSLMAYWRKIMPERFLEVRYEEMVDDTEGGARKLLEWCGLEWDQQVLRFYESKRPVTTASLSQVRQPIYKTSTGRWKKWEPYIGPLLAEIGDLERAYWAEVGK